MHTQEREAVAREERRALLALLARLDLCPEDAAEIRIAIIDGPVDQTHSCFRGAHLSVIDSKPAAEVGYGLLSFHGTAVASIVLGQPESMVPGVCPAARGLIVPTFRERADDPSCLCTQAALARGIHLAIDAGAQLINISGGEHLTEGERDPALVQAVQRSQERGALILASSAFHAEWSRQQTQIVFAGQGEGTSSYTHLSAGIVTPEVVADRSDIAASETPRRPRGLRRVS